MRGDSSIGSRAEDRLGRGRFVEHLAAAFRGASADQGLVVALVGSWGSGKTSILKRPVRRRRRHADRHPA